MPEWNIARQLSEIYKTGLFMFVTGDIMESIGFSNQFL